MKEAAVPEFDQQNDSENQDDTMQVRQRRYAKDDTFDFKGNQKNFDNLVEVIDKSLMLQDISGD